jgi:ubiquinone/menaquinone biosynthesis C-methylase UbiE
VDLAEYREKAHDTWRQMAAGWQRQREWMWDATHKVGESMVSKLEPREGQTILELAAGVGDTGFVAAKELGDDGKLISTDFAPEMVEAARKRGAELGLTNVEYRVMDAEKMDLDDDSVDGVLCRWGYMLIADPAAAFAETRRVLRDGGRLCFSVWAGPERNPWAAIAGATVVQRGHMPPPEPGAPGIFAMGDPARIRALVSGAGFAEPGIDEVPVEYRFTDPDDYWHFLNELAGGIALTVKALPDEERQAVQKQLYEQVAAFEQNGALVFPGAALNVVTS